MQKLDEAVLAQEGLVYSLGLWVNVQKYRELPLYINHLISELLNYSTRRKVELDEQ